MVIMITLETIERAIAHQPHFQRLVHELGDHWSQAAYAATFVRQWRGEKGELVTTDAEVQEAAAALGLPLPVVRPCGCGGGSCSPRTPEGAAIGGTVGKLADRLDGSAPYCEPWPSVLPDADDIADGAAG